MSSKLCNLQHVDYSAYRKRIEGIGKKAGKCMGVIASTSEIATVIDQAFRKQFIVILN